LPLSYVIDSGKLCCGLRSPGAHTEAHSAAKSGRPPKLLLPTTRAAAEQQKSKDDCFMNFDALSQHASTGLKDHLADSPTLVKVLAAHLELDTNFGLDSDFGSFACKLAPALSPLSTDSDSDAVSAVSDGGTPLDADPESTSLSPVTDCAMVDPVRSEGAISCDETEMHATPNAGHPGSECKVHEDTHSHFALQTRQDPAPSPSNRDVSTDTKGMTRWHRGLVWLRGRLQSRVFSARSARSLKSQGLVQGQLSLSRDFRPGDTIGFGSHGRVFTARHSQSGQIVAVKEMLISRANSNEAAAGERIRREVRLCEELEHFRIVQYLGHEFVRSIESVDWTGRLFLFMEYCSGGSIASHLRTYGPLELPLAKKYMGQLIEGLRYLHSRSPIVVHRDLKCANLLLTHDASLKIADFGSSKWLQLGGNDFAQGTAHSVAGTLLWMAPEVLKRRPDINPAVDIWSTGCCLLEMVTASVPWAECSFDNIFQAYRKIVESDDLPAIPAEAPDSVRSFVEVCLQRNPSKRPEATELQKHALFA